MRSEATLGEDEDAAAAAAAASSFRRSEITQLRDGERLCGMTVGIND